MKPEIKQEWLEELRSGNLKQGNGRLTYRNPDDGSELDCCLGVLCKIAVKHGITSVVVRPFEDQETIAYGTLDDVAILPENVAQWASITRSGDLHTVFENEHYDPDASSGIGKEISSLTEMNDAGYTFAEIADVIEKEFDEIRGNSGHSSSYDF